MRKLKFAAVLLALLVIAGNVLLSLKRATADSTPPVLNVAGDTLELSINAEEADYLQGVTATDRRDGDLTSKVFVEHISQFTGSETVKVTYGVFDNAGNSATASRTVHYTDYRGPKFSLSQPLRYSIGSIVTLKDRLSAEDMLDGNITGNIRMTNVSLSNDAEGIYRLRVQVTNSLGDTRSLTLPVQIVNDTVDTPTLVLSDYIVYVDCGGEFEPEDYILSIEDRYAEKEPKKSAVKIETAADTDVPGVYDVIYSYEGEKASVSVVLTLVVTE